jgi:4-alpha-glucanotransferase
MSKVAGEIQDHYVDGFGNRHDAPPSTIEAIERAMGEPDDGAGDVIVVSEEDDWRGRGVVRLEDGSTLAVDGRLASPLPPGYHEFSREGAANPVPLIAAPAACFLPDDLLTWGWAIQLYAARSRRSWGIGDLADLRRLGRWAAREGAGLALISPLAAPTPTLPQQPSPYFPSSRRFRSPLYLRIEEIDGAETLADLPAIAARARALNKDRVIDRDAVFTLKMGALERIWKAVQWRDAPGFDAFVRAEGRGLEQFATFSALAERFQSGWHGWPEELCHPDSRAVRDFARTHPAAERIRFHQWLQFQVERQLANASRALAVMQDLPIGFDPDGADAWAFQDVLAPGMSVGAPRTNSTRRVRTGDSRRSCRTGSAGQGISRSSRRFARPCAMREDCASITSWDCSGCSGFRPAGSRGPARTCAATRAICSRSSPSRASARVPSSSARISVRSRMTCDRCWPRSACSRTGCSGSKRSRHYATPNRRSPR